MSDSTRTFTVCPGFRGSHSSTFQLNVSAFCGTRGVLRVFREYFWLGWRGCSRV